MCINEIPTSVYNTCDICHILLCKEYEYNIAGIIGIAPDISVINSITHSFIKKCPINNVELYMVDSIVNDFIMSIITSKENVAIDLQKLLSTDDVIGYYKYDYTNDTWVTISNG